MPLWEARLYPRLSGYETYEMPDCQFSGYVINPSIGSYVDKIQAAENAREAMLPGKMKKQSKSLRAQVVTRREP